MANKEIYDRKLKGAQEFVGHINARRFAKDGMDAYHLSFQIDDDGNVTFYDGMPINRDRIHKCEASCSVYGKERLECPVCGTPAGDGAEPKKEQPNSYIVWLKEAVLAAYQNCSDTAGIARGGTREGFEGKVLNIMDDGFIVSYHGDVAKILYSDVLNFDTGLSEVEVENPTTRIGVKK